MTKKVKKKKEKREESIIEVEAMKDNENQYEKQSKSRI